MIVIQLDAAMLAKVAADEEPIYFSDESGVPRLRIAVSSLVVPTREPTEEELDEAERDPADYSLAEAWEKIRTVTVIDARRSSTASQ